VRGAIVKHGNFFGSAGALPSRKKHLPIANRHSLSFRVQQKPRSPVCPPTEVGGYKDKSLLKQADLKKGCELRVASCVLENLLYNSQRSILNSQLK